MARNFDEDRAIRLERDRSFTINGETFTYRPSVAPEALAEWNETVSTGPQALDEMGWLGLYDRTILSLLDPEQEDKWRHARRADCEVPINLADLTGLLNWLMEQQSARPTPPSSDSGSSGGDNGTSSTVDSSSPEVVGSPV